MELQSIEEKLFRVEITLSRNDIEMFIGCIDSAIDTKHVIGQDLKRTKEIKRQLGKYLEESD